MMRVKSSKVLYTNVNYFAVANEIFEREGIFNKDLLIIKVEYNNEHK